MKEQQVETKLDHGFFHVWLQLPLIVYFCWIRYSHVTTWHHNIPIYIPGGNRQVEKGDEPVQWMSIGAVTRVWPTNSGITHLFNFEQHELASMYSHSKSDNVTMKYTQRKMSAQQSRREKRNTTASILLHRGKMVLLRQKKNKWCIHQLYWSYFKEIKY